MTVLQVLCALWRSPGELLLRRWNWKSALFSSTIRACIFFFCNLRAGFSAATGAMLAEFAYRSVTAGFYGALTQSFRRATPTWAANLAVMILLPVASHSLELTVHLLRHTPKLKTSIITSVCFTAISTLFNLYAMRRGALIVGEESQSAAADMRRMPRLIGGFIACGPVGLFRFFARLAARPSTPSRVAAGTSMLCLALLPVALTHAAQPAPAQVSLTSNKPLTRTYRATAYVTLLSVPIFSRSGVGGGFASLEETRNASSREIRLRFLSGSAPERAAGLNRLGYIEESVSISDAQPPSIHYFGFITANKEESLAQAKSALNAPGKESSPFVAAEGQLTKTLDGYSVRSLQLSSRYRWNQPEQLLRDAVARFEAAPATRANHHSPTANDEQSTTFLYAIIRAIRSPGANGECRFIHNGKRFVMTTEKAADPKSGEELARTGLTEASAVMRLKGSVRGENSKDQTTFRLWYDSASGNPLPLRFELHPKSYLKLVFDAVPEQSQDGDAQSLAGALPPISMTRSFTGN